MYIYTYTADGVECSGRSFPKSETVNSKWALTQQQWRRVERALLPPHFVPIFLHDFGFRSKGYLSHKNPPPRRTLQ